MVYLENVSGKAHSWSGLHKEFLGVFDPTGLLWQQWYESNRKFLNTQQPVSAKPTGATMPIVGKANFYQIVKRFHLGKKPPRIDTCDYCCKSVAVERELRKANKIQEANQVYQQREIHHTNAMRVIDLVAWQSKCIKRDWFDMSGLSDAIDHDSEHHCSSDLDEYQLSSTL